MPTNTQPNQTTFMLIDGGHTVPLSLFNGVLSNVMEIIHILTVDTELTLKQICDKNFWGNLSTGEKIAAGHCMVHMVKTKMVPIEFAEKRYENSIRYRLKK